MKLFELFLRPVITEKITSQEKNGKYAFFVRKDATKVDIKSGFKKMYGVDVAKVNVMVTARKTKLGKTRRTSVKKPEYKKVIITTKAKKTVDISKLKMKS